MSSELLQVKIGKREREREREREERVDGLLYPPHRKEPLQL
jgi:hypothetical protein